VSKFDAPRTASVLTQVGADEEIPQGGRWTPLFHGERRARAGQEKPARFKKFVFPQTKAVPEYEGWSRWRMGVKTPYYNRVELNLLKQPMRP
jgi:hypothetical protein